MNKKIIAIFLSTLSINSFSYELTDLKEISSGKYKTFFTLNNGYLYTTNNEKNNSDINNNLELISSNVFSASIGNQHALKIDNDNKLYVVGNNNHGQLGLKYEKKISRWVQHPQIKNAKKILAKNGISFVIDDNNTLYSTGWNYHNLINKTDEKNIFEFTKIADNVKDVTGSTLFISYLDLDNNLYAKGISLFGFLNNDEFYKVDNNVESLSGGEYHLIYNKGSKLFGLGSNFQGQLGINTISKNAKTFLDNKISKPILLADNVIKFSTGDYHSCYIDSQNNLFVTGNNGNGQLGLGNEILVNKWTKVLDDVKNIYSGSYQNLAIKNDNTLWISGNNANGQLTFKSDKENTYFYGKEMKTNINTWSWKPIVFETFEESYNEHK